MATSIELLKNKKTQLSTKLRESQSPNIVDDLDIQADAIINNYSDFIMDKRYTVESLFNEDDGSDKMLAIRKSIIEEQQKVTDEIDMIYTLPLEEDTNAVRTSVVDYNDIINPTRWEIAMGCFDEAIILCKEGKSISPFIKTAITNREPFIRKFEDKITSYEIDIKNLRDRKDAQIKEIEDAFKSEEEIIKSACELTQKKKKDSLEMYDLRLNEIIDASKGPAIIDAPFEDYLTLPEDTLLPLVDKCKHTYGNLYKNIKELIIKDYSRIVIKMMSFPEYDEANFVKSTETNDSSLMFAIRNDATKVANAILDKFGSTVFDYEKAVGDTYLNQCAYRKSPIAIRLIKEFEKMIKIDRINRNGLTALILACSMNNSECAELILETFGEKCLPNHNHGNDRSAMLYAQGHGMTKVIAMLENEVV